MKSILGIHALALAALLTTSSTFAAIPKKLPLVAARSALELPMGERMNRLEAKGPDGYRALVNLAFDEKETMDVRWKAVTALAHLGGKDAKPELTRALKHSVWYMRNAGLVAMKAVDQKEALKWANRLLEDKALLVRSAAVDVIGDIGTSVDTGSLWQHLYSQKNFKGGQSLFIRRHIVEALAKIETPGHEASFVRVLSDTDQMLHPAALQALEHLTKQSFGTATTQNRRAEALKWWQSRAG